MPLGSNLHGKNARANIKTLSKTSNVEPICEQMRDDIAEFSGNFDNIFTSALQSVIIASSEQTRLLSPNYLVTDASNDRQRLERCKRSKLRRLTISNISVDTCSTDHVSNHRFRFLRIVFALPLGSSVIEFLAGRIGCRGRYRKLSGNSEGERQEWLHRINVSAPRSRCASCAKYVSHSANVGNASPEYR